jgi:NAD-dependent deacetylase
MDMQQLCDRTAGLIHDARRVVVFTGAGISTESGIPDFRGPGGLWTKYDPDDFTIQKFLSDHESRRRQWALLGEGGFIGGARPNAAHYAITELHKLGKLDCVITQNVDMLHQKAGMPEDRVFELHGTIQWAVCLGCAERIRLHDAFLRLKPDTGVPDCPKCGGILKPGVVFFGEALPSAVLNEASRRARQSDLCLVVGSTLVVYPAAYMPVYARKAGARLVIVNMGETSMDADADVRINGKAGEVMTEVVAKLKARMSG